MAKLNETITINQSFILVEKKAYDKMKSDLEILDIFKSNVVVYIDYKGSDPNNICYLLIFNNGNQAIIKEITKDKYELLKEWLDND